MRTTVDDLVRQGQLADNLIAVNPAEGTDSPTVGITEQRFLTTAELHRLALAAGEHMALVYVLGTTGLRFGEAAELRWRDVDFAGLRLRVIRSVTFVSGQPVDDALVFPDSAGGWMRASNAPPLVGQGPIRRRVAD
jgi:integrase